MAPSDRGTRCDLGRGWHVAALLIALAMVAEVSQAAEKIGFNRDIRPILSENCFYCHGPDSAARKADLRLDRREVAVKSGAIAPGDPDSSELVARIFAKDAAERMPPPASNKKLTDAQKDLLRRWVAAGAVYEPLWSFIPPKRPTLPAVTPAAWVRNPVDRFVLAKLEESKLSPAPEADRRTLARRLSLDLTGLPPAPAEVEAFVRDAAPNAYEKLVDRWLKSPHWGEHRARYWLDVARYADSNGVHFDNYREIWSYRDWVIEAFNRNMPFDQFTIEQVAGDLLPQATLEQQIASGFNRCNITTNEGGAIADEYLVLYDRDRTETTAQVWLGLTAGCAVCHDHKFDPLTQKEFYQMAAFFNNTSQAAMDGNIKDTPPVVVVPKPEDRGRWRALIGEVADVQGQVEAHKKAARTDFDRGAAGIRAEKIAAMIPSQELALYVPLNEGKGNAIRLLVDGKPSVATPAAKLAWAPGHVAAKALVAGQPGTVVAIPDVGDFEKEQPFSYGVWLQLTKEGQTGAVLARMDDLNAYRGWDLWLDNGRPAAHIIHRWPDDALKVVATSPLKTGVWHHLLVTYDGSRRPAGVKIYVDGQSQPTKAAVNGLKHTIRTTVPLTLAQRHRGGRLDGILLQDLRLYGRVLSAREVDAIGKATRAVWLAGKPVAERTAAERDELFQWWLPAFDKPYQQLSARLADLDREHSAVKARGTVAHVMHEQSQPAMAYVLSRGEYDKRRESVPPGTPASLPPMPAELPRNRLGLAKWLLRPEQPLTARVTVNRFWQEVFGAGLVRTPGDFGVNGDQPSHPELLDWLAVEFRESGWDVKRFFRLLVTSATYRQSAAVSAEKLEKDPQNRLLSRGPRFRMDAEMVRDYALAASGLLAPKIGGPSVKPYQPEGVWEAVAMIGSNTRDYRRDSGEGLYRRSMYTFWKRAAPPASMDIFNAPTREVCTVRRERTDTPLQALVTLNDPQFVEAARHLAEIALKAGGTSFGGRLDVLAQRLLARSLRAEEARLVEMEFRDLLAYYRGHVEDAKAVLNAGESKADASLDAGALAAWTMVANSLMNLDEVLNK
jgi:hypothetical protein